MRFFQNTSGVLNVPERVDLFIPWKSENLCEELNFSGAFGVILAVESVDFLLENFSGSFFHVDNLV